MTALTHNTLANTLDSSAPIYSVSETLWHTQLDYPVLSILQGLPLLAVVLLLLIRKSDTGVKIVSLIAVSLELILAIVLYQDFEVQVAGMQYAEYWALLPSYHAAIDGISMLFVLLTAFISAMLVLYVLARDVQEKASLLPILIATSDRLT